MNIVYTCQDNYAKYALVSLYTLLMSNSNESFVIHFIDSGLTNESRKKLATLCDERGSKIVFYNVVGLLSKYSGNLQSFRNNFATYAKLFIEDLLPKETNDCLYIDVDTIIRNPISELFENKNDYTLYMGYDLVYPEHKRKIGLTDVDKYFNAGVIYINLERWRVKGYSDKILASLMAGNKYSFGDQDIFNTVFRNDIGCIGINYNMLSQFFFYTSYKLCERIFSIDESNFYSKN